MKLWKKLEILIKKVKKIKMEKVKLGKRIDELGRITVPIDIRRNMNLDINDKVDFYYDEQQQMFGIKSASFENQVQRKIDDLASLANKIKPDKLNDVMRLLNAIEKILCAPNKV